MAIRTYVIEFFKQLPNHVFKWTFLLKLVIFCPLICITLLFTLWIYLSTETISNLIGFEEAIKYTYDYIIVGGGTSGCILASKLTENPKISVLLIEAGSTFSPLSMIPFLTSQQQRTQNDWKLTTISQKHSSFGFWDQIQFLPRGKGLGGSSQLNYLIHFDGNKKDLERWKEYGIDWWDLNDEEDLEHDKYTGNECSVDTCSINEQIDSKGTHSNLFKTNLPVSAIKYDYSLLSTKFMDGANELHRKNVSNLEYYLAKYNTHKGLRHSVYHTYLKPVFNRPNLRIVLNTRVHKVLFNKKTAVGVLAAEDYLTRTPQKIYAARGVLLASGAFHTPQILKLSGVGPTKELKKFEINVVHNSPMIGRNLYDHMSVPIYVSVDAGEKMTVTRETVLNVWEILNYLVRGSGVFSNFGVIGYVNDLENNHGTGIFGVGTIDEKVLGKIVSYDREAFRANFPFHNDSIQEGFVLLNTCHQPLSRGTVRLSGNRIQDAPEIDPNYLEVQTDVECLIRAIRLSMDLMSTKAFKAVNTKIHWPQFSQCKNLISLNEEDISITDRYLECIIRVGGITAHHPGGSCAIGKAPNSALDSRMQVRGVRKLRVIDASVIPTPVSGHPHSAVAAFAELASKMILYDDSF